ncbi:partial Glutamate racemase, partial [Patescibacteria group bacterium]
MKKILHLLLLIIFVLPDSIFSLGNDSTNNQHFDMIKILNKKKITIVITDSGLGGMSVCAGIENKLNEIKAIGEVNLIYFNSHAEKGAGYNSMPSMEVKAKVFDSALRSMEEKYSPDLILIACNTLSVVYSHTQFAQVSQTPVLGIVDFGVSMILSELKDHQNADVIILGTPTTIKSGSHKQKLVDN